MWRTLVAMTIMTTSSLAADPPLQVGFGRAEITPSLGDKPVFLAGFGQNRRATEIHDPLLARAIVVQSGDQKIALVSVDVVGLFLPIVERIRLKMPEFQYVLVSSTHNHHGPDTMGLWGSSPVTTGLDPEYMTHVENRIVAAVRSAESKLQLVTATIGSARNADLLHDSRAPFIKHDELISVQFLDSKKQPAGIMVQWNCHPETLNSKNSKISADFVGVAIGELEKKFACPVIYLTGTVGGLMTSMHVDVRDRQGNRLPEGSFEKNQRYGELVAELAGSAIASSKKVQLTPITYARQSILLPVDNPLYRFARTVGVLDREMEAWTGDARAKPGPALAKVEGRPAIRSEVSRLRLGELEIAVIPGEIYPELVIGGVQDPADPNADFPDAPIEPTIYANMTGPYRMIVGLGNDELGYILPKRQWDEKAPFCYGLKKAPYGEVNSLGPETGPIICWTFRRLAQSNQ